MVKNIENRQHFIIMLEYKNKKRGRSQLTEGQWKRRELSI